jgi:ATP-dependent DNA helicase RecG
LSVNVTFLKGVSKKRALQLKELGVETVDDLVRLLPRYYEDRTNVLRAAELREGMSGTLRARIMRASFRQIDRKRSALNLVVEDGSGRACVTFYNQQYNRGKFEKGAEAMFFGRVTRGYRGPELVNPEFTILAGEGEGDGFGYDGSYGSGSGGNENVLSEAERRAEEFSGIYPVYPLTRGINQKLLRKLIKEALALLPPFKETLPREIIDGIGLPGKDEAMRGIHCPATLGDGERFRRRLAFDELLETRLKLILMKSGYSNNSQGIRFNPSELTYKLEQSLPFELTSSQQSVWREVMADMASARPMNRLVMGDVGSGKTVLAMLAMLMAAGNGVQSALMAPTEVLAEQHYANIAPVFGKLGVSCALLTGAVTGKKKEAILSRVADGTALCVIGTHALIQSGVRWHKLGLAVTDEQHRFGVRQRGSFLDGDGNSYTPDVMVMTATPIPRTLAMILYGDLDISRLDTLPTGRKPIITYLDDGRRRDRIYNWAASLAREGQQVYIVHPAIGDTEEEADDEDGQGEGSGNYGNFGNPGGGGSGLDLLSAVDNFKKAGAKYFSGISCALLHGRMPDKEKNDVMRRFAAGEISVLFSTTVIEVGVDVANATLMIIENSERFGLSQLHQLRGRVGRGALQSYCVLMTDHHINPNPPADDLISRRLITIRDCLSGDKIADEDLKLRGPGDFFGVDQHGLPAFHAANLYTDNDLLELSEQTAQRVLEAARDNKSDLPEKAALRQYLDSVRAQMPKNTVL